MREKSAYQYLLEKAQALMRRTEGKPIAPGELPKGILERLAQLERIVQEYLELNQKLLQRIGVTPDDVARAMAKPNTFLSERDAATMRFGKEVLQQAKSRYMQLSMLMRAMKERNEAEATTGAKKGEARRRKFRRLGGKGKWMPM